MRSKNSARACAQLGTVVIAGLLAASGCSREAQTPATPPPAAVPEAVAEAAPDVRVAADDMKAMVAPIALYPDPVLELVLQGATQPGQVVLAVRFLDGYAKNPSLAPDEAWDTAVVGLLNYPRVIGMMNDSLDWTTQVGESVASDLDGVQGAVQELRWSAYNTGILASNEWQDVIVNGGMVAILPTKQDQLSIPEYDGAALLDVATESAAWSPPPPAPGAAVAPAPATTVVYAGAPAAVPVSYGAPQSSFWSNAALFAGGAAVGGLIGYMIGDDDDDDHYYRGGWYGWGDDWDNRPWRGGNNQINIGGDVILNPARPGVNLRPNRPITRPALVSARPGRPNRPALPEPIVGRRPGKTKDVAARPGLARPGYRPKSPAGIAPARPATRPAKPGQDVKLPRPVNAKPRPAAAKRRDAERMRPAAKVARAPERKGALAPGRSNPQVQRDRARGAASRQHAQANRSQRHAKAEKSEPSLKRKTKGGRQDGGALGRKKSDAGKQQAKAAKRGKQSRGRR